MFGYKLIKKKDLEDLSVMQLNAIDAIRALNNDDTLDVELKSINVLLKIDDLICKAK